MTISFKKFYLLNEAIPLDVAKDYLKRETTWDYRDGYKDIFEGRNRIVIGNLGENPDINDIVGSSPLYLKIFDFLELNTDFTIDPEGYIQGMANSKVSNSVMRLGRLLGRFNKETREIINSKGERVTVNTLLHEFNNDPLRQANNKPFFVVVSKHPYDVMGASTDRNWTSCMDMGTPRIEYKSLNVTNRYPEKMDEYVKHPTLIAYLVDPNDVNSKGKLQIKRPISRIMIYPFRSDDGEYAHSIGEVYGVKSSEFFEIVKGWVSDTLNKNMDEEKIYNPIRDMYYDGYERDMVNEHNNRNMIEEAKRIIKNIEFNDSDYDDEFKIYDTTLKKLITKKVMGLYRKLQTKFSGVDISYIFYFFVNSKLLDTMNGNIPDGILMERLFLDEFEAIYRIWDDGSVTLNAMTVSYDTIDYDYDEQIPVLKLFLDKLVSIDKRYVSIVNDLENILIGALITFEELIDDELRRGVELKDIDLQDIQDKTYEDIIW